MTLRNRLLPSATAEAIACPDGSIDQTAYSIYEELSQGGVGGIITGFTSVASKDTISGDHLRLSDDKIIP